MAAWTMSGARKASDNVMRADRSLRPSRTAIVSMLASSPDVRSASQRRPFAMAARSLVLASTRIGRGPLREVSVDGISSRLRRKACGDQGIVTTGDRAIDCAPSRSWISTDWPPTVIRSTKLRRVSFRDPDPVLAGVLSPSWLWRPYFLGGVRIQESRGRSDYCRRHSLRSCRAPKERQARGSRSHRRRREMGLFAPIGEVDMKSAPAPVRTSRTERRSDQSRP